MNAQANTKALDALASSIRERLKDLAGKENDKNIRSRVMDDICQLVAHAQSR